MSNLETRNIFIDTSIFVRNKFQFHDEGFQRLVQLRKFRSIRLYTTDITKNEILLKIEEFVEKAIRSAGKFRSDATILSNIDTPPFSEVFIRLDKDDILEKIKQKYTSFSEETKTREINVESVSNEIIFHKYFNSIAPFSSGEKKCEFPDAFVVEAISDWCGRQNEKIYLISGDKDFQGACEGSEKLLYLDKIEEFISLINEHDKEYGNKAIKLIDEIKNEIETQIEDSFTYLGFWLEDQDGEVLDIDVHSVNIKNIYFIDYDNDTGYFELETDIDYSAEVEYDDLDTAHYDSEDKQLYPWRRISKQLEESEEIMVNLRVDFDVPVTKIQNYTILNINSGQDISLRVEEPGFFK